MACTEIKPSAMASISSSPSKRLKLEIEAGTTIKSEKPEVIEVKYDEYDPQEVCFPANDTSSKNCENLTVKEEIPKALIDANDATSGDYGNFTVKEEIPKASVRANEADSGSTVKNEIPEAFVCANDVSSGDHKNLTIKEEIPGTSVRANEASLGNCENSTVKNEISETLVCAHDVSSGTHENLIVKEEFSEAFVHVNNEASLGICENRTVTKEIPEALVHANEAKVENGEDFTVKEEILEASVRANGTGLGNCENSTVKNEIPEAFVCANDASLGNCENSTVKNEILEAFLCANDVSSGTYENLTVKKEIPEAFVTAEVPSFGNNENLTIKKEIPEVFTITDDADLENNGNITIKKEIPTNSKNRENLTIKEEILEIFTVADDTYLKNNGNIAIKKEIILTSSKQKDENLAIEKEIPEVFTIADDTSLENNKNLTIQREKNITATEKMIELSNNRADALFDNYYCSTASSNNYPGVSRIDVELVPIVDKADQPLPNIRTASRDPRKRKLRQRYHSERKRPKNLVDKIREINLLLQHCSNTEQRRALLFKKKKIQEERSNLIKKFNSTKMTNVETEKSDRVEMPNKIEKSESDAPVFVRYHEDFFIEIDDEEEEDDDEETNEPLCKCSQKNVSDIEVRLKNKLKRLQELSVDAHDLRKRTLESKITQLEHHLSQPHICDERSSGQTKEILERQLNRLQLLSSIPREKGEDENWLKFKMRETEMRLNELQTPGSSRSNQPYNNVSNTQSAKSSSHGFYCSCLRCKREHLSILEELDKCSQEIPLKKHKK